MNNLFLVLASGTGTGTGSISSIIVFLSIIVGLYFLYKISRKESDRLRYALYLALMGVVLMVFSQTGNFSHSEAEAASKSINVMLICGIVLGVIGGSIYIDKRYKNKKRPPDQESK